MKKKEKENQISITISNLNLAQTGYSYMTENFNLTYFAISDNDSFPSLFLSKTSNCVKRKSKCYSSFA